MIIEFPTALYSSVLPKEPSDNQSVTFLISSTDPPRSISTFFQLLYSEELKTLPGKIYSDSRRRANLGEFIFNVSYASPSAMAIGNKAFETGQLLDFPGVEETEDIDILEVPEIVEVQQNGNILDLESLGLDEEESDDLTSQAETKFHDSIVILNDLKMQIKDKKASIDSNQKLINETRKARDAAVVVFSDTSTGAEDNEIVIKLNQKEQDLLSEKEDLLAELNSLIDQANEIYGEILRLREMVR